MLSATLQLTAHPSTSMSEPKRFGLKMGDRFVYVYEPHADGQFVLHSDYARLKAEVERLTKENETITKDKVLLWASHKIALQDIQGLHYALQTAKEGKQS
jgi:hypothetical protein